MCLRGAQNVKMEEKLDHEFATITTRSAGDTRECALAFVRFVLFVVEKPDSLSASIDHDRHLTIKTTLECKVREPKETD